MTSCQMAPARTRARRAFGSIRTPRMRLVESRMVFSRLAIAAAPWPVPWGATRRPCSRAKFTISITSASVIGMRHRGGALVDGQVPGAAGLVPAVVVRSVDLAVEAGAEGFDVGAGEAGEKHGRSSALPVQRIRECPKIREAIL